MPDRAEGTPTLSASPEGSSRVGAKTLSLFATPLNSLILRALAERPLRLGELRQIVGGPAQTTLRAYLCNLIEAGAVAKVRSGDMPYAVAHELSPAGRELLDVLDVLEVWLAQAPQGEIKLGTEPAKAAIKAFTDAWDAAILRALVATPLTLTELDSLIADVSYPSLERRLSSMRVTGLLEPVPSNGNGTPYAVTEWARRGIAPLVAAARWERRHLPEAWEVTWVEVEAGFLMVMRLVELPQDLSGECVLALDTKGEERRIAGVHVVVQDGEVVSCETELRSEPPTFALGSAETWLEAVTVGEPGRLHARGNRRLFLTLLGAIHQALLAR